MAIIVLGLTLGLVSNLIQRLPNVVISELEKIWDVKENLMALNCIVETIQTTINELDNEELAMARWRPWVQNLITNFSEAEDVMDGIYLAIRKYNHEEQCQIARGGDQVSTSFTCFTCSTPVKDIVASFKSMSLPNKIDSLLGKFRTSQDQLDGIIRCGPRRHRNPNSLEPNAARIEGIRLNSLRQPKVHLTKDRKEEKKFLIKQYLRNPSFKGGGVSIFGMAGSGKTTLARSILRDKSIKKYFNKVLWASGPRELRSQATIFIQDGSGEPLVDVTIHSLQQQEDKILLVLDDIWNVERDAWKPFLLAARNNVTLLITTRDPRVAEICEIHSHHIKRLSDNECKDLIKKELPRKTSSHDYVIERLAEKCCGLPLVAKKLGQKLGQAIGSMCRTEESIADAISCFVEITDVWDLRGFREDIFSDLKFNDPRLPPEYSNKCLPYLTLFPQDYDFKRDKLSQLWLAEGFFPPDDEKQVTSELIKAGDYFDDLYWRSILRLPNQEQQVMKRTYQMHELFRGFARSMPFNTCHQVTDGELASPNITGYIRHLSVCSQTIGRDFFKSIQTNCKRLRSFLLLHKYGTDLRQIPEAVFTQLSFLRVVNLNYSGITCLPRSICNLKHLRYLDISHTPLETVNNKLCDLYGLQILRLKNCSELSHLPEGIGRLVNLIFLEFDIQKLRIKPSHIGSLINLRVLEEFVVGKGQGKGISELQNLKQLRGLIRIKCLENITDVLEARRAKLIDKPHLKVIELYWTKMSTVSYSSDNAQSILDALELNLIMDYKNLCYPATMVSRFHHGLAVAHVIYGRFICTIAPIS